MKKYMFDNMNLNKKIFALFSLVTIAATPLFASSEWAGGYHASGIDGNIVYLNDLEDHNWNYYKLGGGIDSKYGYPSQLCSPDPRNVKITYIGNGIYADDNSTVSGVQVSTSEAENTFVYYETLEKGTDNKYAYSVIPNPFSKRPSRDVGGSKKYYGCRKWKVTALSGGTINDASGNSVALNGFIDVDTDVKFTPSGTYTINCISMEVELTAYWEVADRVLIAGTSAIAYSGFTKNSRELNFLVLNRSAASTINSGTVPITVMMQEPDGSADYNSTSNNVISSITMGDGALKIEYATFNYGYATNPSTWNKGYEKYTNSNEMLIIGGTSSDVFRDIHLGRGLMSKSLGNFCIPEVFGCLEPGNNSTYYCDYLKNRIRIESGKYFCVDMINGSHRSSYTRVTVNSQAKLNGIFGCDYDRAKRDNTKLNITDHFYVGAIGYFHKCKDLDIVHLFFKSGTIMEERGVGTASADLAETAYMSTCSAKQDFRRKVTIEGGVLTNMSGGWDYSSVKGVITFDLRMKGGTFLGSIGTGAGSTDGMSRRFVMTGGQVKGWICGGCIGKTNTSSRTGTISKPIYLYIGGKATVGTPDNNPATIFTAECGSVFGAGCGNEGDAAGDNAGATGGTYISVSDGATIYRSVYGGGNNGYLNCTSNIFVLGGTIHGKIFGGCNKNNNIYNATGVVGSNIVMLGGTVKEGIYGGSNASGKISAATNITLSKGTVGQNGAKGYVHGGGYGASTEVAGLATVVIGEQPTGSDLTANRQKISDLTIYGEVYGGSALGKTTTQTVKMYSGTVNGDIYAGALGNASTAAQISGTTQTIDIYGGKVTGSVFGGSNVNASLTASTKPRLGVSIHNTYIPTVNGEYAIGNVFGGGNGTTAVASGQPGAHDDNTNGTFVTVEKGYIQNIFGGGNAANVKKTTIDINTCEPVIGNIYGGCNAANIEGSATTTIWGGTIGNAFAGGNGVVGGTPANVGGNALLTIHGGTIGSAYAGSNNNGTITGTQTVAIDKSAKSGGSQCPESVGEVYSGGNMAAGKAGTINIDCTAENIGDVYGGANQANITTPITLNITAGKINRVFGGNNNGGSISGAITVNINKSASCSNFSVGTVYGGGNKADYSAPSGSLDYPKVNILAGIVSNDVFGGGLVANVKGNPAVTINGGTVSRDVYGGGSQASVTGNTSVTLTTGTVTGNIYGGGLGDNTPGSEVAANVSGTTTVAINGGTATNIFGCNNLLGAPQTGATVKVSSGTVTKNVYGGGNLAAASVSPVVTVNGGSMTNVYGGGLGASAVITGNPSVTINKTGSTMTVASVFGGGDAASVKGSPTVNLNNGTVAEAFGGGYGAATNVTGLSTVNLNGASATVSKDIYGGSALGSVTGTNVTITNGTVSGSVYGGGLGDASNAALVNGDVQVTVDGGKIDGAVYGCNNVNGSPVSTSTVQVDINATPGYTLAAAYGGGNVANSDVTPILNINTCDVNIDAVYGGGNAAETKGTNATIWGGTIGSAFGGGNGTVQAANVDGNSSLTIHGGTITSVYAGSNSKGTIEGTMALNIDQQAKAGCSQCTQSITEIYGGGNQAEGKGAIITIGCGSGYLGNVYGGAKAAKINGDLTLNIKGGEIDNVFGGNNESGEITGKITVNIDIDACPTAKIKNVYGGGNKASYTAPADKPNSPEVNLISGTIGWTDVSGSLIADGGGNVFGGGLGSTATIIGNPVVNLVGYTSTGASDPQGPTRQSTVLGSIYGGGDLASVTGNTTVKLTKGITEYAFGGGNKAIVTGNTLVNLDGAAAADVTVNKDLYGGGSLANVVGNTDVQLTSGTVSGNVYGGGLGDNTSSPTVAADVTGTTNVEVKGATVNNVFGCNNLLGAPQTGATVTVTSGTVTKNVYGGGNLAAASVSPAVTVNGGSMTNVYGGGLGASAVITGNPSVTINKTGSTMTVASVFGGGDAASVIGSPTVNLNNGTVAEAFGGGYGAATNVTGLSTVNLNGASATVSKDIYGGSALGSVTGTQVTITDGTVSGSVYGGGLGDASNAALVSGDVQVTVDGGTIDGAVFGCNNVNGAPISTSKVQVDINHTTSVGAVYGGGNLASYNGIPTVNVNNCDVNIGSVYGGGNAADVSGTNVNIWGGTIGDAFAGGNGVVASGDDPGVAANVNGDASLVVHGGTVTRAFAGSNNQGTIAGSQTVTIDQQPKGTNAQCAEAVDEVYGGGNLAAGKAGTINIDCTAENIGDVYGGANQATITNDIVLNITQGKMKNVFGGNNTSGDIKGTITVNVNKAEDCSSFSVDNVYGGGNKAAYTAPEGKLDYPQVNILSGTVNNDVFGGGLEALVTGNPQVSINGGTVSRDVYGGGSQASVTGNTLVTLTTGTVTGNIYGGGLGDISKSIAANVSGTTTVAINGGTAGNVFGCNNLLGTPQTGAVVNVKDGTVTHNVYGGGNLAAASVDPTVTVSGGTMDKVFGGGNEANIGASTINVSGGTITTGLYGGCNTTGTATSSTINLSDGSIGSVFGGGYGEPTVVSGNVDVNVGSIDGGATAGTATVTGDVYGGSALGCVGTSGVTTNHVNVIMNAGSVGGSLYGGGLGRKADVGTGVTAVEAKVYSPVQVTQNGGTITGDIFGCNNLNGAPASTVQVDINKTDAAVHAVYGGGNLAAYTGTPVVNINTCDVNIGSVYGGGNAAATGGTNATINGGTIGNAFGGGNGESGVDADVNGNSSLTINGGTITNAFAGSNMHGAISGTMALNVGSAAGVCPLTVQNIYGGGNQAEGKAATITIGCGSGYLGNVYGGAKAAKINGDLTLNIKGGEIDNVFGGNNESGEITGKITVNIDIDACPTAKIKNVYGGGNKASYTAPVANPNSPEVNLISGTIGWTDGSGSLIADGGGNVFGGGLGSTATIIGNPVVNLVGYTSTGASDPQGPTRQSTVLGSIYGGGDLASVTGNTTVKLTKGITAYAFGGGNKAIVTGNTLVNLNGAAAADVTVNKDLYGGGSLANVEGNTDVQLTSGTVAGNVYGGGLGDNTSSPTVAANVTGTTNVEVKGATVNNVFGCNNLLGAPQTGATVKVTSGTVTNNVYGGGNLAAASVSPVVSLTGGTVTNDVFGAGLGTTAVITGDPTVTINGGAVSRDVYGGGSQASVTGNTAVTLTTGAVTGNIYGGGLGQLDDPATTNVDESIAADVSNAAKVFINGGTVSNVFGCNNVYGAPQKYALVSIDGGTINGNVFGGGNKAAVSVSPVVSLTGGSVKQDIFGGGNQADVDGAPVVKITGGIINGNVFGGGNEGNVTGSPKVTIGKSL